MATGGGQNTYSRCSMCLDDERNSVARHYCVQCEVYFCLECVKSHRLPALKTHQVNDVDYPDWASEDGDASLTTIRGSDVPTDRDGQGLRCPVTLHRGKVVDTYCKDHDDVCCGTCAIVKHRSCETISIDVASNGFKSCPEIQKTKKALNGSLTLCRQEKKKRDNNIDCIGQKKIDLLKEVDQHEEKLIAKINELANVSREEIRSKYTEHKTSIDHDATTLDAVETTITSLIEKIENTCDEQILFAEIKSSIKEIQENEMLLNIMATEWRDRELDFYFYKSLETSIDRMTSLGRIERSFVTTEYFPIFHKKVAVALAPTEVQEVNVYDMCLMDSNDLILADFTNVKLKCFSPDLYYKDELLLTGNPIAVCKTGKDEVAVRIWNSKIVHFVSVGESMQILSSFTLADNGYGMAYDPSTGEIYACEENKVSVYNKTGDRLRTYDNDTSDEQIFSACRHILLTKDNQNIYVSDKKHGLVILNKNGTLKRKVAIPGISVARSLCLLPGNNILIGDQTSDVSVPIGNEGELVGDPIYLKEKPPTTWCAVYDREHARLIIGGTHRQLSIYTMCANLKMPQND